MKRIRCEKFRDSALNVYVKFRYFVGDLFLFFCRTKIALMT